MFSVSAFEEIFVGFELVVDGTELGAAVAVDVDVEVATAVDVGFVDAAASCDASLDKFVLAAKILLWVGENGGLLVVLDTVEVVIVAAEVSKG